MLAETDLQKKIAKFCRATYLTAIARIGAQMDTARKDSITARTGLERCTVRARIGTIWARNWHNLGSKTAPVEFETCTLYARKRHDLGLKLARKHPKAGLENKHFWHEKQRFHHFGWVKFCSNTTNNFIKSKIKQITR